MSKDAVMLVTRAVCIGCAAKNKLTTKENENLLEIFRVIKNKIKVTKKCSNKLLR